MKIIYIANLRLPTEKAHGIQVMKMCEAFAQQGNELELIIPRRINSIKDDPFDYYGVARVFRIRKIPCLDLIFLDKYIGHLGLWVESLTFFFFVFLHIFSKRADIFYTRDKFLLSLALIKNNIIFESHTFPKNYFLYSPFIGKLRGVVVITHKLKDILVGRGISSHKVLVSPDSVDLAKFDIKETKEQCREKLNLPSGSKIILYTGHLYRWKGAQVLAEASSYLPKDEDVYFVGGTAEDIKKFSARGGSALGGKINIIGHRPYAEIPYWLKAADVLVLPNSGKEDISQYWTSPLKMFEYMASGRPIVSSSLPSIKEILNEENAVLVEPDNPVALASAIERVLQSSDLSERISAQALKDVQNYSWDKRAKNILWFYQKN